MYGRICTYVSHLSTKRDLGVPNWYPDQLVGALIAAAKLSAGAVAAAGGSSVQLQEAIAHCELYLRLAFRHTSQTATGPRRPPDYRGRMPSADLDKARSRLIEAVRRSLAGARLQRDRIRNIAANAPKLLEGTEYEVVNLTGQPDNDLDYYAYELARLQDTARTTLAVFGQPQEIVDALATFDADVPNLRKARNPLTHPSNDARLDDVGWLSALVRYRSDGGVEYLVDPRYQHHTAAEELAEALLTFLRRGLRT